MKNYVIAFMMSMLLTGTLSAQSVNLGVKGGLNVYNVSNNNQYNPKAGVHLGLLGHIHLANTSKWALQPEIMYSSQGARIGESANRLNLDYINVPVLFQYMFDNGFRLQAGPQLGFLVNANTVVEGNKIDRKDDYKGVDLGLSLGASYVHPPTGFGIDARYNLGLTDISRNESEYRNNGFQLGVFYLFNHRH